MCRAKSDGHPLCLSNGDHTCSRDDRLELQVLETGKHCAKSISSTLTTHHSGG